MSSTFIMQIGITALPENQPNEKFGYEVMIWTGIRPNSGTTSLVSIDIEGDISKSGPRYLIDGRRKIFKAASINSFLLTTSQTLGNPMLIRYSLLSIYCRLPIFQILINCTIRVWHDNSGLDPSWYISHILVRDLQNEAKYYFILNRWLSVNKEDQQVRGFIRKFILQLFILLKTLIFSNCQI